jgi:hypothetical protein
MDRAAEALSVPPFAKGERPSHSFTWVAFFEDTEVSLYERRLSELPLIDEAGRVLWVDDFNFAPYGELLRANEVGLVAGDVRRLYLIRQIAQGDFFPGLDWQTFLLVYLAAKNVLNGFAKLGDAAEGVKTAAAVIEKGLAEITKLLPGWGLRGATPQRLQRLLAKQHWTTEEVATLLGCSPEDAEAILRFFEYDLRSDGRWHPGTDDVATVLKHVDAEIDLLVQESLIRPNLDYERLFRDHFESRLRTGEPHTAEVDEYELPVEDAFPGMPPPATEDAERSLLERIRHRLAPKSRRHRS